MDEADKHFLSASHRKCILLSGTECHIIKYLLTELAQAVPGNIGLRLFLYGPRSALSQPWADIPQYGPRARLVRGYYCYHFEGHWQNKNWKKSDNETVQREFLSTMLEGNVNKHWNGFLILIGCLRCMITVFDSHFPLVYFSGLT